MELARDTYRQPLGGNYTTLTQANSNHEAAKLNDEYKRGNKKPEQGY